MLPTTPTTVGSTVPAMTVFVLPELTTYPSLVPGPRLINWFHTRFQTRKSMRGSGTRALDCPDTTSRLVVFHRTISNGTDFLV